MPKQIFVNLPVRDLQRSMSFFEALGWSFNPQFTDETAACLVISDEIYAMLVTHQKFGEFTKRRIADEGTVEALIGIAVESPEEVHRIADAALASGGREINPPQDYGFMQLRTFADPDGHHWEVLYLDPAQAGA